jgi:dipeptidyl aminopeptidase/acylaminoacyl peptidase
MSNLRPIRRVSLGLGFALAACGCGQADPIAEIFQPYQTEQVALAPDGKHLAYSLHHDDLISVILLDLDTNKARQVDVAKDIVEPLSGVQEKSPSSVTYLRWTSGGRLIFSVNDIAIWAIDADGSNPKELVSIRDLNVRVRAPLPGQTRRRAASAADEPGKADDRSAASSRDGESVLTNAAQNTNSPFNFLADNNDDESGTSRSSDRQSDDVFDARRDSQTARRRPFVARLPDDDPDHIYIEARGTVGPLDDSLEIHATDLSTTLYKIDVHSGKILAQNDVTSASRVLADRQGHLRLAFNHFDTDRDYIHFPIKGGLNRSLDSVLGENLNLHFRLNPGNFLERRSIPVGFDYDPNILYVASNESHDTYGLYAIDLTTKKKTEFTVEHPTLDLAEFDKPFPEDVLVFDHKLHRLAGVRLTGIQPSTMWLDRDLAQVQKALEKSLPDKTVQLLEWDDARNRFLLLASSNYAPGAYYVYDRAEKKLGQRAERAPWIKEENAQPSTPFVFDTPDHVHLSGYLTLPRSPRLPKAPLLIYCHDGPWNRDLPGYNRGAQALASMGFAVAQINFRGSSGYGYKYLHALQGGYDQVALADVLATVDFLTTKYPLNHSLVAILGNGYGGYLALRALELYPDRFRCAVSINAPTTLPAWLNQTSEGESFRRDVRRAFFGSDQEKLKAISPLTHAKEITKPVFIIQADQDQSIPVSQGLDLNSALAHAPEPAKYLALRGEGHNQWLPGTYATVFKALEDFFNDTVYNFQVKVGETVKQPDQPK